MRLLRTSVVLWAISLWIEPHTTLRPLKEAHDIVRMEALRKVAEGLTPLTETTRRLNGGRHPERLWANPSASPRPGSAMYGVKGQWPLPSTDLQWDASLCFKKDIVCD